MYGTWKRTANCTIVQQSSPALTADCTRVFLTDKDSGFLCLLALNFDHNKIFDQSGMLWFHLLSVHA